MTGGDSRDTGAGSPVGKWNSATAEGSGAAVAVDCRADAVNGNGSCETSSCKGDSRGKGGNLIREKAMAFAERMFHLNEYLIEKRKYSLADQVFRSGTSIGANLSEAVRAESDSDFVHKYSIAMKEAEETRYWLELAWRVKLIDDRMYRSLRHDCDELIKIGTSIVLAILRKMKAVKADKS